MRVFVDTSAFYALLDRDDANHRQAGLVWPSLMVPDCRLITTNYVLVESFALLQNRLGMAAVRAFQEDLCPLMNIEFIAADIHRSAVSALLAASRRGLSLVDCTSFEVMRVSGIKTAFVFDPHFRQQGFETLPRR